MGYPLGAGRPLPATADATVRSHSCARTADWGLQAAAGRYVETHEFYFDEVFDERVRNEEALTPASWPAGPPAASPAPPCVTAAARALKQTIDRDSAAFGGN